MWGFAVKGNTLNHTEGFLHMVECQLDEAQATHTVIFQKDVGGCIGNSTGKCSQVGCILDQYDDYEEEVLDLSTEKFELLEEEKAKKFRRLRRFSIEEDEDEEKVEGGLRSCGDDDSEDEDWEMKTEKEAVEDEEMKLEDLGLVNEDEVEEEVEEVVKPVVKKRKSSLS
ncbi:hypothetical protein Tco_0668981 [Tanacetum coccineum]